jgi:hypothetical protein
MSRILLNFVVGSGGDTLLLAIDPLRMGEATGTAVGSGASAGGVVLAVGQDALRFAGLVGYFRVATAAGSSVVGKLAPAEAGLRLLPGVRASDAWRRPWCRAAEDRPGPGW